MAGIREIARSGGGEATRLLGMATMMKPISAVGLVALTMAALPATAADKLPSEFLGHWCAIYNEEGTISADMRGRYRRAKCDDDINSVEVGPSYIQWKETGCDLLRVVRIKSNSYRVRGRCSHGAITPTIRTWRMSLQQKELVLD